MNTVTDNRQQWTSGLVDTVTGSLVKQRTQRQQWTKRLVDIVTGSLVKQKTQRQQWTEDLVDISIICKDNLMT